MTAQKNDIEINTEQCPDCILCGTVGVIVYRDLKDTLFGAPGTWNTMRCPECGLFWIDPSPTSEAVGMAYDSYYTHSAKDGGKQRLSSLKKSLSNHVWKRCYGYRDLIDPSEDLLGRVLSYIPPLKESVGMSIMELNASLRGSILDIGGGNGDFLSTMRDLGWQVYGVEPDQHAVKYAKEIYNLELHQGTLENAGFPDSYFDVVTMNHVIEHVHDPVELVRQCGQILKRGGRLVVVTPNVESVGHRLFKQFWRGLEPPRHLHLFSLKTIQQCAEQAGLNIEHLRTTTRSARSMFVGNWFLRKNKSYTNEEITWPLWISGVIFQFAEEISRKILKNAGEEIVLVCVKQDDIK
ncbi:MAG: class I SAM-dependent methyltransferase [Thermoleophilia bacterium]